MCCFSFCYIYIYCLFRFVSRFNSQIVYERETHIMILEYICIRTPYLATLWHRVRAHMGDSVRALWYYVYKYLRCSVKFIFSSLYEIFRPSMEYGRQYKQISSADNNPFSTAANAKKRLSSQHLYTLDWSCRISGLY